MELIIALRKEDPRSSDCSESSAIPVFLFSKARLLYRKLKVEPPLPTAATAQPDSPCSGAARRCMSSTTSVFFFGNREYRRGCRRVCPPAGGIPAPALWNRLPLPDSTVARATGVPIPKMMRSVGAFRATLPALIREADLPDPK
jgi:hypothetical protein